MAQKMEDFSTPMMMMTMTKRECRSLSRCSNLRNPSTATAAIQAISQARSRRIMSIDSNSSNGGVQVKIVMSKKELKQMVASMGLGKGGSSNSSHRVALEQMLHVLRKKQMKRAESCSTSSSKWQPALQSIPEEL